MVRRCEKTLSLLDWEPPQVVDAFEAAQVRAPTFKDQMARAVAVTLADCEKPREEIAREMAAWLGEEFNLSMLNAYASQAKKEHTISANRLTALCVVTGDVRCLQLMAEQAGRAVVERRYLAAIEWAELTDQERALAARKKVAHRTWKTKS